jgi:hypothetical protein
MGCSLAICKDDAALSLTSEDAVLDAALDASLFDPDPILNPAAASRGDDGSDAAATFDSKSSGAGCTELLGIGPMMITRAV